MKYNVAHFLTQNTQEDTNMDPKEKVVPVFGNIERFNSVGGYLDETKETYKIFKWMFTNATTPESIHHLKVVLVCIVLSIITQAFQPGAVSYIFDGLRLQHGQQAILGLILFAIAISAQKIIARFQDRAREFVLGIHSGQMDNIILKKFFALSLGQHTSQSNLLSPTTIDKGKFKAIEIQRVLIFDGTNTLLQLMVSIACLFFLSKICGFIMLAVFICYVIGSLYLNSKVAITCAPLDQEFRQLNRKRHERMDYVRRVVINAKEDDESRTMNETYQSIVSRDRAFWLWFLDVSLGRSGINVLGLLTVMSVGMWMNWTGQLSLGLLYPLFAWANKISENMWKLGDVEHQINWNIPPVKSMVEAVSLEPEIVESANPVIIDHTTPHHIKFADISHTYPNKSKKSATAPPAIRGISFDIEPGQWVALLGPSGAGKSTVMNKLLRYSDPTSGQILINGIDLRDISLKNWRSGIGHVAQASQVFYGDIKSNLLYGLSDAERALISDEELWRIMRLLKIDFEERLVDGLSTLVGKNGTELSGGQQQRLMIGAAILKNPWLLVLDEATSALDSTTEKVLQEGLAALLKERNISVLIIAHRFSTVVWCDKFVMLKPIGSVALGESQIEAVTSSLPELAEQSAVFRQLAADQDFNYALAA